MSESSIIRPGEDDYCAELADLLDSDELIEQVMSMPMLDGFVTALAIGPARIEIEEWLPQVFDGVEPSVQDEAVKARLYELIGFYYEDSLAFLRASAGRWLPWIEDEDDPMPEAEEWAAGFSQGVSLREKEWAPILEDDLLGAAFIGILSLVGIDDAEDDADLTDEDRQYLAAIGEKRVELADQLPLMVASIHEYWHGKSQPPLRRFKVGRNDLCPCGSGKKHKRCCGAN